MIEVLFTPPGFAPKKIRWQWAGIVLPTATREDMRKHPPRETDFSLKREDNYMVLRDKAVSALEEAGREEAAKFWRDSPLGNYLAFPKNVCSPCKKSRGH